MKTRSVVVIVTHLLLLTSAAGAGIASRPSVEKRPILKVENEDLKIGMLSRDAILRRCMYVFADQDGKIEREIPALLDGMLFFEPSTTKPHTYRCLAGGTIFALAPVNDRLNHAPAMERLGFTRIEDIAPFPVLGQDSSSIAGVFRKALKKGDSLTLPAWTILAGFEVERKPPTGEVLYNGIVLPKEWPPQVNWRTDAPMPIPYLERPPRLINIDVGRQLLVDDFLVESTDLRREYHYPEKYAGNPILRAATEIEKSGLKNLPGAGPKSGGLFWNPEKQLFELWYEAGWVGTIAYATSRDGLAWERPALDVKPGTNQVLQPGVRPDSWTVHRDYRATDVRQSYKLFLSAYPARWRKSTLTSDDGIRWEEQVGGLAGDRSTAYYNPFRKKWIYSLRWTGPGRRSRAYLEADDFVEGGRWLPDEPIPWLRTDRLDPPDPRIGDLPQLYNVDAVAYESIMLGFFEILHGPSNEICAAAGLPKNTGLNFAYSRDGFHWHRPDRKMAINSEQKTVWDRGYVQSLGNICTIRGDKLWFYYIGFAGDPSMRFGDNSMRSGMYANFATGVAFLRRDGFVSLNADAERRRLTTRPITFSGKHLFVNAEASAGAVAAELVDMQGKVIEPFSLGNCLPARGDSTLMQINWKTGGDLSALNYRAVRIRFEVTNAKVYAFWVSRDETGRSDGYVAGGGPGFTCDVDNVGRGALEAEKKLLLTDRRR